MHLHACSFYSHKRFLSLVQSGLQEVRKTSASAKNAGICGKRPIQKILADTMSTIVTIIEEVISSIEDIETVVTSFKKGYVDNVLSWQGIHI